jgi:hypothetical protein
LRVTAASCGPPQADGKQSQEEARVIGSTQGGGGQEGMAMETPHLTDQTQNQPHAQTQPPMETMVSPLTAHLSTIAHMKDSAVTHTDPHSGLGEVGSKGLDVE